MERRTEAFGDADARIIHKAARPIMQDRAALTCTVDGRMVGSNMGCSFSGTG
jgi:hypothetical protein